ncbi:MAG: FhaA domain-containing protein [Candidatus Baltobacteraceae bacterium]
MNPFVRIEAWCANAVERAFALAFPSELEPVQIARRLVATFEGAEGSADGTEIERYVVRVSRADAARLEPERAPLETQWTRLVGALRARAGRSVALPSVELRGDASLPVGTIAVDAERASDDATPASSQAQPGLGLRVVRGIPVGAYFLLPDNGRAVIVGRDPACEIALGDPRVSRRHLRLRAEAGGAAFADLGSANGTRLNGEVVAEGHAGHGDRLQIGDSILVLEGER